MSMRTLASGENQVACGRPFEPCVRLDLKRLGERLRRLEAGSRGLSGFEQEYQELLDHVTSELAAAAREQKASGRQRSPRVHACLDLLESLKASQMLPLAS